MAKICVEIELDTETGAVMVGVEPPESYEDGVDKSYLQPAASVDEAINTARGMLQSDQSADVMAAKENRLTGMRKGYMRAKMGPMGGNGMQG